jgi:hypothetical protein
MELFQMPTEESMLQVCSIWLLKMCIGSIVPELETSSKFSYRFCLERNYLNTPDTQRFSVKGSLDFILELFPAVHYIFMPNLGIKGCRSIWAKKSVHEKAIDHLTAVDPIFIEKYGVPVIPERPQGLRL